MLGADVAEADRRLGTVALAADLEDHALAERRVGDVVADAQSDRLRVRRLRRLLAGAQRCLDDPLAVLVGRRLAAAPTGTA